MNIEIYINERPVSEYSQEELQEIKVKLTETAMRAAGFKRNEAPPKDVVSEAARR